MTTGMRQPKKRPRWAQDLWFWLTDGQYDHLPDDAAEWRWTWREALLAQLGQRVLCLLFGHKPVPDQCNKPEHDFCVFCNKPTPLEAVRPLLSSG